LKQFNLATEFRLSFFASAKNNRLLSIFILKASFPDKHCRRMGIANLL
jgi:hypothetical protein